MDRSERDMLADKIQFGLARWAETLPKENTMRHVLYSNRKAAAEMVLSIIESNGYRIEKAK